MLVLGLAGQPLTGGCVLGAWLACAEADASSCWLPISTAS